MATVIFGFPGTGKTRYFNDHPDKANKTIFDSDSSYFHWLYPTIAYNEEEKIVNPVWPLNYINHILKLNNNPEVEYIFVSTHDVVMNELAHAGLNKCFTVVPEATEEMFKRFSSRFRSRGSSEGFIINMKENWKEYIEGAIERANSFDIYKNTVITITPTSKIQYISDIIDRNPIEL